MDGNNSKEVKQDMLMKPEFVDDFHWMDYIWHFSAMPAVSLL